MAREFKQNDESEQQYIFCFGSVLGGNLFFPSSVRSVVAYKLHKDHISSAVNTVSLTMLKGIAEVDTKAFRGMQSAVDRLSHSKKNNKKDKGGRKRERDRQDAPHRGGRSPAMKKKKRERSPKKMNAKGKDVDHIFEKADKNTTAASGALAAATKINSEAAKKYFVDAGSCKNCFLAGKGLVKGHTLQECKERKITPCHVVCNNPKCAAVGSIHWNTECPHFKKKNN